VENNVDYAARLRTPVYGLWSGKMSRDEFSDSFETEIDKGLRRAWVEGLEKAGIAEEDMTEEDDAAATAFIFEQYSYVSGFADFIEANSKANGGKLGSLQYRLGLWAAAYGKAINAAMAAAAVNPLYRWVLDPSKENCKDCEYADGRVYRKSVWVKWGWTPGNGNTECNIGCGCEWETVPKGTKADKGHPRRLSGG
jgi:hypothetical protein